MRNLQPKKRRKLSSIELTDGHVNQTERSIYKITLSFPIKLRKAPSIPQASEATHRTPTSKSSSNVKNPNETNESNNPPGKQVEEADVAYHPPTRYGKWITQPKTIGLTNQSQYQTTQLTAWLISSKPKQSKHLHKSDLEQLTNPLKEYLPA